MNKTYLQPEKTSPTTKSSKFFKPIVQKKLEVGASNDSYEKEADSMAAKVMSMSESQNNSLMQSAESVQRCACEDEKLQKKSLTETITPLVQRSSGETEGIAPNHVETGINSSKGSGKGMDNSTLNFMESRFGNDFSGVRIHTGSNAIQMSRELNAQAFTVGNDIYFNEGKYNPGSNEGKHLLAHELTHTIQQGGIKRKMIQKSCHDGNCGSCGGGMKNLAFTVFFRIMATAANMRRIRALITEAKNDFKKCCINASFYFNWDLLRGGGTFDPGVARPSGSANGAWDYANEAETLGEGTTFNGVKGTPVVFVDDVPRTGGGVTMDSRYDAQYTGTTYMAVSVNQAGAIPSTFAHEFGHVAGLEHNSLLPASNIMNTGTDIDARFCNAVRAVAT